MERRTKSRGFTRSDGVTVLVALLCLGGLLSLLVKEFQRERMHDNIARCGGNLSAIGKAMAAYASDYNGALPVAGGRGTKWTGRLPDWSAGDRTRAFALDPSGSNGEATVSSSLYLLVRHMQLDPKSFVCPVDRGTCGFRLEEYGANSKGLTSLWDFGPDPGRHCSYACQMVYSPYKLTLEAEPAFAVAGDRNPWIDGPWRKAGTFSNFMPDLTQFAGTSEQAMQGNALAHRELGQNVLFLDMHVTYEKRSYCGVADDNIYTSWERADKIRGKPPQLGSQPADANDSLLVNDPPAARKR
jgi:hypothetical protein